MIGENVAHIAGRPELPAVLVEHRVLVDPLPLEAEPVVEPRPGVRLRGLVPLADERRLVPCLLQDLGEGGARRIGIEAFIRHYPVLVGIAPRQEGGAARGTERGGDEGVPDVRSLAGDSVEVRGLQETRASHEAHGIETLIVSQDEEDVRALRRTGSTLAQG